VSQGISLRLMMATAAVAVAALLCAQQLDPAPAAALSGTQQRFLRAAESGVTATRNPKLWWERGHHWYRARLHHPRTAGLWQVVSLFEAVNGIAIASPTRAHRRDVIRFGLGAERYLNPNLEPVPGFGPRPNQRGGGQTAWFDDNGWWGLAFLNAYRATGLPRFLHDAEVAQGFISVSGWDDRPGSPGGIWWNTNHGFYAGESLASGTELSVRLYGLTHEQHYLDDALKFINWADTWLYNDDGFYARLRTPAGQGIGSSSAVAADRDRAALARYPEEAAKLAAGATPATRASLLVSDEPPFVPLAMPYVQGPMIVAFHGLCETIHDLSFCERARGLAERSAARFPYPDMGPQYDQVFIRDMLEYGTRTGDVTWYRLAKRNAKRALRRSRVKGGLNLRTWDGDRGASAGVRKGSLQLHSATTSIFAWMAATPSP
jgi:hypothetical protein